MMKLSPSTIDISAEYREIKKMIMEKERRLIVEYGIRLSKAGLCPGTSGNLSICLRDKDRTLMAISPSGMDYFSVAPEDIVVTDLEGNIVDGSRKPSSEWALHALFYRNRPDVNSVVHTHSLYCTTFAVLKMPIKAVHFAIGAAGVSEVKCAPYELFGTEALAETAVRECGSANAVLLANHGIICCGSSVMTAFSLAENMEYCARLQYQAMSIGTPELISDENMIDVFKRLSVYGQKR